MKHLARYALYVVWVLAGLWTPSAWAEDPVVRAVLFYSPSCPHCHKVINEDLPPLFEKYGDQLQIVGVNTTEPGGHALFQAAAQRYHLERLAVPTLIIGDVVLVGSVEIPEKFPAWIETYLAQGGVDWPDIPGLAEALAAPQPTPTVTLAPASAVAPTSLSSHTPAPISTTALPTATPAPGRTPTATAPGLIFRADPPDDVRTKLARDPLGNALAIVVLIWMVLSVSWAAVKFRRAAQQSIPAWKTWAMPALTLIGLGVAGYLAYVETAQVTAVCGPVGDCNTVQQSEYARLFGLIPIGLLGVIGYLVIAIAWIVNRYRRGWAADLATLALFGLTLFGTLFSIYLTFLEPFVIGATCVWCLTSATIITLLMLLSARLTVRSRAAEST